MIHNLSLLLPEIFLAIGIFFSLMVGVFKKNSYNLVTNLSLFILLVLVFLIFDKNQEVYKIFF